MTQAGIDPSMSEDDLNKLRLDVLFGRSSCPRPGSSSDGSSSNKMSMTKKVAIGMGITAILAGIGFVLLK